MSVCVHVCVRVNRNPRNQRELRTVCSVRFSIHIQFAHRGLLFMGPSFVLVFRMIIQEYSGEIYSFPFFFLLSYPLFVSASCYVCIASKIRISELLHAGNARQCDMACICTRPPIEVNRVGIASFYFWLVEFFFSVQDQTSLSHERGVRSAIIRVECDKLFL